MCDLCCFVLLLPGLCFWLALKNFALVGRLANRSIDRFRSTTRLNLQPKTKKHETCQIHYIWLLLLVVVDQSGQQQIVCVCG